MSELERIMARRSELDLLAKELGKQKCHGLFVIAHTDDKGRLIWGSPARPGHTSEITACRHDKLTAHLREAGLGAIADLRFVGLDDSGPDAGPAVITGYKAARNRPLGATAPFIWARDDGLTVSGSYKAA